MPRVQAHREKLADDGSVDAKEFLDCEACKRRLDRAERATMHCGFLAEKDWADGVRPYSEATTCPGYTIQLPEVLEASRALLWANRGELRLFYEPAEVTPIAKDCVDLLDSAVKGTEREVLREQREEMKKNHAR